jgi:hypothetical protein
MLNIFYFKPKEKKRWFEGDQAIRAIIRRILRGTPPIGGIERVFVNFKHSLEYFNIPYRYNPAREEIDQSDINILFGVGPDSVLKLEGIPLIAAIGIIYHPSDFPNLHQLGYVHAYLSHSDWSNLICKPYWGDICYTWPAGIDTEKWKESNLTKEYFLVYDKIRWHHQKERTEILNPILEYCKTKKIPVKVIRYGHYKEDDYFHLLQKAKGMIFVCEHESQGIACNQAMSMNVPIFAWDRGTITDPNFLALNEKFPSGLPSCTSVPFFDETCGERFKSMDDFYKLAPIYFEKVELGQYSPSIYTKKNLSFKASLIRMNEICELLYNKSFIDPNLLNEP